MMHFSRVFPFLFFCSKVFELSGIMMAHIVLLAIKFRGNPVDSMHDRSHCQALHRDLVDNTFCMISARPLHGILPRLVFAGHWAIYAHNDNLRMGVYFCEKQMTMKHTHIKPTSCYPFPGASPPGLCQIHIISRTDVRSRLDIPG